MLLAELSPLDLLSLGLLVLAIGFSPFLVGLKLIPNDRVGIVEKLWSRSGSIPNGRLIALNGEAGFQAGVLRGGIHFGFFPWQYRVHHAPLTVVSQGQIGYVFARDGQSLAPNQTLGCDAACDNFQDVREFLSGTPAGQKGRQRAVLREGVYAINLAQFVVITRDKVFRMQRMTKMEAKQLDSWRVELQRLNGFDPVIVGNRPTVQPPQFDMVDDEDGITTVVPGTQDEIAIVTVHDGPSLTPGKIIAPPVGTDPQGDNYHGNFQDVEAFLRGGGRRGRQYQTLTDGTYFINRWFATVELIPKTVVPIGHVGVVVSYFGESGSDVSGTSFRHGERVAEGGKGVQAGTLGPGKYAFNTSAGAVHSVPTTNFVLHWITGRSESHMYDESLKSIDLVTADAYEPMLPLSIVVHIDYQKAANVVQRFGDVKKLITQTLDPLLSAYFRDIAHKKTMLELLHDRDKIQVEAREVLQQRFANFDIELVDVLIGKPVTAEETGEIETLLDQLRLRQLSREQVETYQHQCTAAEQLKQLKMAEAQAEMQTELTNSKVQVSIAENTGDAELAYARKKAEQDVVAAEAQRKVELLTAEAKGKAKVLMGEGESQRMALEGEAQAEVLRQKIASYGNPELYAMSIMAEYLSQSKQPLVPEHLFTTGAEGAENGMLGTLMQLLVRREAGFVPSEATLPTAPKKREPAKVDTKLAT